MVILKKKTFFQTLEQYASRMTDSTSSPEVGESVTLSKSLEVSICSLFILCLLSSFFFIFSNEVIGCFFRDLQFPSLQEKKYWQN